jgi:hypothetical protein
MEEYLLKLRPLVEIQGNNGNWNYDDYMCGLFNGLEMALSLAERREPIFRKLDSSGESVKGKD